MELYISLAVIATLFIWLIYLQNKKRMRRKEELNRSLEDETIYVEGVGQVRFEDMDEMVKGDPEYNVKYVKETMFMEDLMKFKGEFLIPEFPLNEERRLSIDDAFLYILELFGEDIVIKKPVHTPYDLEFAYSIKDISEVKPLADRIATIMDIDPRSIELDFFEGYKPVEQYSADDTHENDSAAGLYYGKNDRGKYEVSLADNLHKDTDRLIATIAHEFAHIKLLGENRIVENSEELTDMLPLFYGLGIFSSSSVFKFKRETESWTTSKLGYLTQIDWAYLFALYLYTRNDSNTEWMEQLNKTVKKECLIAYNFMIANPEKVLQPSY